MGGMSQTQQGTSDEVGQEDRVNPVFQIYKERAIIKELTTTLKKKTGGGSFLLGAGILGTTPLGLVDATWTDYLRVVNPNNLFIERIKQDTFNETGLTTADWDNGVQRIYFDELEEAHSRIIASNVTSYNTGKMTVSSVDDVSDLDLYISGGGVVVNSCDSLTNWTYSGDATAPTLTSARKFGTHSIAGGKDTTSTSYATYKYPDSEDLGFNLYDNEGNARLLSMWFYIEDTTQLDSSLALMIFVSDGIGYAYKMIPNTDLENGWNYIGGEDITTWSDSGNPDFTDINIIQLQVMTDSDSTILAQGDIKFDHIMFRSWQEVENGQSANFVESSTDGIKYKVIRPTGGLDLTENIISYYKLDGSSGVVTDSVGSYDGTNNGATRGEEGILNTSFKFESASSQYVDDFGEDLLTNNFTISGWFNPSSLSGLQHVISQSSDASNGYMRFAIGTNDNKLYAQQDRTSGTASSTGSVLLNDMWYHFVFTSNSDGFKVYLNGVLDIDVSNDNSLEGSTNQGMNMGRMHFGAVNASYFNGRIDEIGTWRVELTAADAKSLYNNGEARGYGGRPDISSLNTDLAAYYKCDLNYGTALNYAGTGGSLSKYNITSQVPGVISYAFEYNGTDSYMRSTSLDVGTDEWAISFWMYSDSSASSTRRIIGNTNSSPSTNKFILEEDSDTLTLHVNGSSSFATTSFKGGWHHVIIESDGTDTKVYLDNVGIITVNTVTTDADSGLYVGGYDIGGNDEFYKGKIDEIGVWQRTLTSSEKVTLYNDGSPPSFIALNYLDRVYWKMDEASGNIEDFVGYADGIVYGDLIQGVSGKINDGIEFPNSSARVRVPENPAFIFSGKSASMGGWIYVGEGVKAENKTMMILSRETTAYELNLYSLNGLSAEGVGFTKSDGGSGSESMTVDYSFNEETWYNVIVTFDNVTKVGRIYVNGVEIGSNTFDSESLGNNGEDLYLGRRGDSQYPFEGKMDEIGMWEKKLISAEIYQLYNRGDGLSFDDFGTMGQGIGFIGLEEETTFDKIIVSNINLEYT